MRVSCLTANQLFKEFAKATHEHLAATNELYMVTGPHEAFAVGAANYTVQVLQAIGCISPPPV